MENDAPIRSYVDSIITKFGGLTALARALGHQNPSTVQGWKERGVIPARQQPLVLDAGRDLKDPVTPDDFFAQPEDSSAQQQGAAA